MYISEGRKTLANIVSDIEILGIHEKHLRMREEEIEARIGIKSSILGDRIQKSIEVDRGIIEYIAERGKIVREIEETQKKRSRLEEERKEIEGIIEGSSGEEGKIVRWYFIHGLSGYEIEYRTSYSKSQIYRIIGRYKRGDKMGLTR